MRTTLDLDDDVLLAAKEIAARDKTTIGKVVSRVLRGAFQSVETSETRNGFPLFPRQNSTVPVSLELINRLRDEVP